MMKRLTGTVLGVVIAMAVLSGSARAGTTTWTAGSAGYWTNGLNWSAGVPGPTHDAVFNSGAANAVIDGDVTVNSLSITGAYSGDITFEPGTAADLTVSNDLTLGSGARIVPTYSSLTGNGAGRVITVLGNARIDGTIDGTGCGFLKNNTDPGSQGPGFTTWSAAHGGKSTGTPAPYGSVTQPTSLGSGNYNGRGGGAIKLEVGGALTLDGAIIANADNASYGAAGGSVWLECDTLAGAGAISANSVGGTSYSGAGGRIALTYSSSTFTGSVAARATGAAHPGSLWEPGRFTNAVAAVTLDNAHYQYYFPSSTTDYTWGLTVTNGAMVFLHDFTNGVLSLTNLVVAGGSTLRFDVDDAGSLLQCGLNAVAMPGASVSVQGSSVLALPSATYTCSTFTVSAGSTVYVGQGDTSATNTDSGGTAGNPHGTGAAFICADATINGTLQASSAGFAPTQGPGGASKEWDGGSYGGLGGGQGSAPTAPCYGPLTRPTALGSGAKHPGAHYGGGALKLVATNSLVINGAVRADGGYHSSYGGDSGGSLWLVAGDLSGGGAFSAVGGRGSLTGSHGGGGGGRIAVEYVSSTYSGTMTVAEGPAASSAFPARTGTLFQCQSPYPGACSLGYDGMQLTSSYSVRNNDVKVTRQVSTWAQQTPRVVWTDTSSTFRGSAVSNVATYTLTGMPPNKGIEILTNSVAMVTTNTGPAGTVTFDAILTAPLTLTVAVGGMPSAATLPPSSVTTNSAVLNGWVSSTGWSDTAGLIFWGPTDGLDSADGWSNLCVIPAPLSVGAYSTNVSLPATGEYFYRCAASNASGLAWTGLSEYLVAGVRVAVAPGAIGERSDTADFWVSRGQAATSRAVTVSFLVGGTASNLQDYTRSLASDITLAAGANSGKVHVVSSPDILAEPSETVIVTLTADTNDFYAVGSPGAATLTITNSPPLQLYWVSPTSGYWTNGANWSGGVAPTAGDDVFFTSGSATVTIDGDLTVNELTVTGTYAGTITFEAGVAADLTVNNDLVLKSGARIVPTYSSLSGNGTGRVITVLSDARIDGTIDATGCGFLKQNTNPGYQGPGFTMSGWSAAHGGRSTGTPAPYGSVTQPTSLGSGNYNGRGGGAIKLKVGGTLTFNGAVIANADDATYAAAGGSVWLECDTLAGSGGILANSVGGASYSGAGGRVALTYNTKTFTGSVDVAATGSAQPGSLWDPELFAAPVADITLNDAQYQYYFPSSASNCTWGLIVTNGANVYFHDFTNGVLSLTNLIVADGSALRFDVNTSGSLQEWGINSLAFPSTPVSVQGSSVLALPSATYTCNTFSVEAGSTVYVSQGDTSATNTDSGGTAGNPHGTGAAFICANATINGTLQASSSGFAPVQGPGGATKWWDGGSYGGLGGGQATAPTAPCYGSLTRPTALGSGAAYGGSHRAGGALKLTATHSLVINGAVRADGGFGGNAGGDSGGSIWLVAGDLSGGGVVSAVGGQGNLAGSHGGGGGGRIAIDYVSSAFSGTVSVVEGAALSSAFPAEPGTLFECRSPVAGACSLGVDGQSLLTSLSVDCNDVKLARTMVKWRSKRPEITWTDSPTRLGGTPMTNTATYELSGLAPGVQMSIYTNDALMLVTNATPAGVLTFGVSLAGSQKINVEGPINGTIFLVR